MRKMSAATVAVLFVQFLSAPAASAQSEEYPILFVHGFCSSSDMWWPMINHFTDDTDSRARFSSPTVLNLYDSKGTVYHLLDRDNPQNNSKSDLFDSGDSSKQLFTIDFFNDQAQTFKAGYVNDTGIRHKGVELSTVIKEVVRISGKSKVIVVAHSLGGLAARAYVEGVAKLDTQAAIPFNQDVAAIITIDTPHRGSDWTEVSFGSIDPDCGSQSSRDKDDLSPGKDFLSALNAPTTVIPDTVKTRAIISYSTHEDPTAGDGIVSFLQQQLTTILPYRNVGFEHVLDYLNPIDAPFDDCVTVTISIITVQFCQMHTTIYTKTETINKVKHLIFAIDAAVPATLSLQSTTVPRGTPFTVSGSNYTPNGYVPIFVKAPGSNLWARRADLRANYDGLLTSTSLPTDCNTATGTWSVMARDESNSLVGDFNGDAIVNSVDYSLLNARWFTSDARTDINRDGLVNSIDFSILNGNWFQRWQAGRVTPIITFTVTNGSC